MADTGFWAIAYSDPGRSALVAPTGQLFTFGELAEQANQLTHALHSLGLRTGDGIAIMQPNSAEFVAAVLAAAQAGLHYTPIDNHLTGAEIAHILTDSGAAALLTHERLAAAASAVDAVAPDLHRVAIGEVPGFRSYADLMAGRPSAAPADRLAGALLAYTPDPTGWPRGVRRPLSGRTPEQQDQHSLPHNALAALGLAPDRGEVHLCASPLHQEAPLEFLLSALQLGHTVVLLEKFDAEKVLAAIERHRVTSTYLVPIQFRRLLRLFAKVREGYDLSTLRVVAHGAAPCPPDIERRMIEWLGPVLQEYYPADDAGRDALDRPGTARRTVQKYPARLRRVGNTRAGG